MPRYKATIMVTLETDNLLAFSWLKNRYRDAFPALSNSMKITPITEPNWEEIPEPGKREGRIYTFDGQDL